MQNYIKNNRLDENRNRAYDMRRDDDYFKTPSISPYDIDYAILYHIQNNIKPTIVENNKVVDVPVLFAAGETWAQIQKYGFARDKSKKAMTPLIVINRINMRDDERFEKLRGPNSHNIISYKTTLPQQQNNKNDRLSKTFNTKKSETVAMISIPDRVVVSYDVLVWTELTTQMNDLVQSIKTQHKMNWGDELKFTTLITDYSFETVNDLGSDRIVRTTLPIEVWGVLQPEYELQESTVRKAHSIKRVEFKNDMEQFEVYPRMDDI